MQLPNLLILGDRTYDLSHRALVMGVLNATPDSFFTRGTDFALDAFFTKAEQLVHDGADLLDVGGVKAGPGEEVTEAMEMDRVVERVAELVRRFDVPISVDTWRASVARECYKVGAVMGNDISGFGDPDYLPAAAEHGAAVVATHIRLKPRVADPNPIYSDLVANVTDFLLDRAQQALDAGIPKEKIIIDAGLDLGKTTPQSIELLRASASLSDHGYPLLLSASMKGFLGETFGIEVGDRREASIAANALGMVLGCRVLRVHDAAGIRRARDEIQMILDAG
jgi:dihydropteroate synthase